MRESHVNKLISFPMELIFVSLFFTLTSAACVLVLETAEDKNDLAANTQNALQYRENLVTQRKIPQIQQAIQKKIFYLGENENWSSSQAGYYRIEIEQKKVVEKSGRALCELCVYHDDKELVHLPFLLEGGIQK